MSEVLRPTSVELLVQDRLSTIMHEQAGYLALSMAPYANPDKAVAFAGSFNDSLCPKFVEDEERYLQLPALIDTRRHGEERIFYFDYPTFEELCYQLGSDQTVGAEDVAKLYTGLSLATKLMNERLSTADVYQVAEFLSQINSPINLDAAIKNTPHLNETERKSLEVSMMFADDITIHRINVLRFGFGMLFMKGDGPFPMNLDQTFETRLTKRFLVGLNTQLIRKQIFIDDAMFRFRCTSHQAEEKFMESLSELTLGACFPMSWREMRTILQISK